MAHDGIHITTNTSFITGLHMSLYSIIPYLQAFILHLALSHFHTSISTSSTSFNEPFINTENKIGDKLQPCATPCSTLNVADFSMPEDRHPKQLFSQEWENKPRRGRQRKVWGRVVDELFLSLGLDKHE